MKQIGKNRVALAVIATAAMMFTGSALQAGGDYLPVERVQPKYPKQAFDSKVEGSVVLSFTVKADGSVDANTIEVLHAKPAGYFEAVTRDAALQFRYTPKTEGGTAVATTDVKYRFTFDMGE